MSMLWGRSPAAPVTQPPPNTFEVKDSGERQDFSTGARRDTQEDKPRFELITPYALERIAWVYTRGAEKYGESNWQKGMPYSRYLASAFRHIYAWMRGFRDEDHLAMACWNLMAIMHHEEVGPTVDREGGVLDDVRALHYWDVDEGETTNASPPKED